MCQNWFQPILIRLVRCSLLDTQGKQMTERACRAVLISREMGSGGSYIGHLVAQDLGFRYIDRVIVHEAARRLGTDEEYLAAREERSSSLIENVLAGFAMGASLFFTPPLGRPVYDKDLFTVECRIMNDIVDHYNGGHHRAGRISRPEKQAGRSLTIHSCSFGVPKQTDHGSYGN